MPSSEPPSGARRVVAIEVVEDRSSEPAGFLRVARLVLRNHYEDGSCSPPYACDVVSRAGVDAVTVLLFARTKDGETLVGLREAVRAPVWLRRGKCAELVVPDDPPIETLSETVAGILEPADRDPDPRASLARRAAIECAEEVGLGVAPEDFVDLGGASFPSPGVADERVHFLAAEVDFAEARAPRGDGSVMEEAGRLVVLPLRDALAACRSGENPDMKTEIALARLADSLQRS